MDIGLFSRSERWRSLNDINTLFVLQMDANLNDMVITREVFNILDLLGTIGGIQTIIIGCILFLFSSVANHIFIIDAIENFYLIKKPNLEIIF